MHKVIFTNDADAERLHFFASWRVQLENAAMDPAQYQSFMSVCHNVYALFAKKYPTIPEMELVDVLQNLPVDMYSKQLLPQGWKHVTPLQCLGDGNCLYRCVKAVCGMYICMMCDLISNHQPIYVHVYVHVQCK